VADPAGNLRQAFELFEFGCRMQRESLKRRHPEATEEEVEKMFVAWLHERPGAEHGDASGPFRPRPI
jgi:Rv0078B-related antitoxin